MGIVWDDQPTVCRMFESDLGCAVATLNFIAKMVAPLPGHVSNYVSCAAP